MDVICNPRYSMFYRIIARYWSNASKIPDHILCGSSIVLKKVFPDKPVRDPENSEADDTDERA